MSEELAGFLFFGSGAGASFEAAAALSNSTGILIDKSEANLAEVRRKGFAAEQGDVLGFERRNVAGGAFVFDVIQELGGRTEMNQALINAARAARDYIVIQHPYFDGDNDLALRGMHVPGRFGKRIKYRPMVADYIKFMEAHFESLQISGAAIFTSGHVSSEPLGLPGLLQGAEAEAVAVPKTLRVVIGRKSIKRFHSILDRARTGRQLFLWERA